MNSSPFTHNLRGGKIFCLRLRWKLICLLKLALFTVLAIVSAVERVALSTANRFNKVYSRYWKPGIQLICNIWRRGKWGEWCFDLQVSLGVVDQLSSYWNPQESHSFCLSSPGYLMECSPLSSTCLWGQISKSMGHNLLHNDTQILEFPSLGGVFLSHTFSVKWPFLFPDSNFLLLLFCKWEIWIISFLVVFD